MALTGAGALPLQLETTDKKKKTMPGKAMLNLFRKQKLNPAASDGPAVKGDPQAQPQDKRKGFAARLGKK